jgi:hypothetical protein
MTPVMYRLLPPAIEVDTTARARVHPSGDA